MLVKRSVVGLGLSKVTRLPGLESGKVNVTLLPTTVDESGSKLLKTIWGTPPVAPAPNLMLPLLPFAELPVIVKTSLWPSNSCSALTIESESPGSVAGGPPSKFVTKPAAMTDVSTLTESFPAAPVIRIFLGFEVILESGTSTVPVPEPLPTVEIRLPLELVICRLEPTTCKAKLLLFDSPAMTRLPLPSMLTAASLTSVTLTVKA